MGAAIGGRRHAGDVPRVVRGRACRHRRHVRGRPAALADLDVDRAGGTRPRSRPCPRRRRRRLRARCRLHGALARGDAGQRRSACALPLLRFRGRSRGGAARGRQPHARDAARVVKELDERIERALGSATVRYEPRAGGYSTADRFAVTLADGRRVFVKSAEAPNLAGWLRREHEVYASLSGGFIPALAGWDDDGVRPLLAIEDLSEADWTPRWDAVRVEAVLRAIHELGEAVPPPNTTSARETFPDLWDRWRVVEADPGPFLSLGLRDRAWLERSLPAILAAA